MKQTGHIQTGLFHLQVLFIVLKKTILKGPLLASLNYPVYTGPTSVPKLPIHPKLQIECCQESFNWKEFVLHILYRK